MKEYIAHSRNTREEEHLLNDHLDSVGLMMGKLSLNQATEDIFVFTGNNHDLGKYLIKFQDYIHNGGVRGSVPHAIWGAFRSKKEKLFASALAIAGHHSGLPNKGDFVLKLKSECENHPALYDEIIKAFAEDHPKSASSVKPDNRFFEKIESVTQKELFVRYLFSTLVDADWLDTESHFDPVKSAMRQAPGLDIGYLISRLNIKLGSFEKSPLNSLRTELRNYALTKAKMTVGFFSLVLPTGMGKTLCSVNWALEHARANQLKRLIIVLPYISIIDQTATVLKSIFGDEYVLEDHSGVGLTNTCKPDEQFDKKQLAAENWDFPVIVTTSVQFFESLFSNQPSKCRKLHNIKDSVVIFDEVQSLPKELVKPTLTMLNDVNRLLGTSFLFCTATQPAFEKREDFPDGIDHIEPLVASPDELFRRTQRVKFEPVNGYRPIETDELADKVIAGGCSALVVLNTKKKAALFYEAVKNNDFRCIHLSTTMCPAHRKRVIKEISCLLAAGEKIVVSSTQLIEAGVDMDFPAVYREIAPLESIIQSAGRCNREGKMPGYGIVYIFSLTDKSAPDYSYAALAGFAKGLYENKEERLSTFDFFTEYYRRIMHLFFDSDKHDINGKRRSLQFEDVAADYTLIPDKTTPILIYKYDEASRRLYERLKEKEFLSRDDRRAMNQYCVQVYDHFIQHQLRFIGEEKAGFKVWHGGYDDDIGMQTNQELNTLIL